MTLSNMLDYHITNIVQQSRLGNKNTSVMFGYLIYSFIVVRFGILIIFQKSNTTFNLHRPKNEHVTLNLVMVLDWQIWGNNWLISMARIDDNMEESLANVEGARSALLRHLNQISSNRWLLIKIFAILIIFMIVFILFVA